MELVDELREGQRLIRVLLKPLLVLLALVLFVLVLLQALALGLDLALLALGQSPGDPHS